MRLSAFKRGAMVVAPVLAVAAGIAFSGSKTAHADDADKAAFNERCGARLSIALLGQAPSAQILTAADPQASIDQMIASPAFVERFSRFINSEFNSGPGAAPTDDAVYFLTKQILTNNKPWSDLYLGKYTVDLDASKNVVVKDDPNGLGYFRSPLWMKRYAGNESAGYRISSAYHIINNVVGLELTPSVAKPGDDRTATGRQGPNCAGCHYQNWYALDKVAKILSHRVGQGDTMTFTPPNEGPQTILDNQTIADDASLVSNLVNSTQFKFHACRLAFQFLYGRAENQCEGPLFDQCVDNFTSQGTIQAAVSTVAKDPGFCQ